MADGHGHDHHDHAHDHDHDHAGHDHADHDHLQDLRELGGEAFGVPFTIIAVPEVLKRARAVLPPGWRERPPAEDDTRFQLRRQRNNIYFLSYGAGGTVSGSADLQVALEVLDSALRQHIALHAPEHVFVHAGVVAHRGRAIVIPGRSFAGKTTLVAELVRAGATYLSDEYAALDAEARVHPYPKPLSMRDGGRSQTDRPVEALGGSAGTEPLPIGLVVVTKYEPGAVWEPQPVSGGDAVLDMLSNTVPAQERPQECMVALTRALRGVRVLKGDRGEAAELAPLLLAELERAAA